MSTPIHPGMIAKGMITVRHNAPDPASGRFPSDVLDRFAGAYEIEIVTQRGLSAPVHHTPIWSVVDEERRCVYVRSVRGERGRLYRELRANPEGEAVVDGVHVALRAIPAGEAEIERASEAFRQKYGKDPYVGPLFRPEALPATLRLAPR